MVDVGKPVVGQKPISGSAGIVTQLLALCGTGLFGLLIWRVGPRAIGEMLLSIGWSLPLVFLPHALVTALESSGWWFALLQRKRDSVRFQDIFRFTVSAKAVQLVTPSVAQAGELLKVDLLRRTGASAATSVASVVCAKTTITISELLFIGSGLAVALKRFPLEPYVMALTTVGLGLAALVMGGILLWQRSGLFRPLVLLAGKFRVLEWFVEQHHDILASVDGIVKNYLTQWKRFGLSCLGYYLGWLAGALEAWIFLALIGLPPLVLDALAIQLGLVIVTRLTAFMPGNLGTHEAAILVIFSVLGFSPQAAMVFALLRRLRQIGWAAAGLGLLWRRPREAAVGAF
ncbi:MAG TPA: flippase-like domain-containing protein [Candidatus Binatia bacterium]|nr:flippase-like domain-containing protein [Candidatus Binatia bacterium]